VGGIELPHNGNLLAESKYGCIHSFSHGKSNKANASACRSFGFPAGDMSGPPRTAIEQAPLPIQQQSTELHEKQSANPLGVCSVFHENEVVNTCPIRSGKAG